MYTPKHKPLLIGMIGVLLAFGSVFFHGKGQKIDFGILIFWVGWMLAFLGFVLLSIKVFRSMKGSRNTKDVINLSFGRKNESDDQN